MKLNKIFKWSMVVLIIVSFALLVWGFVQGFTAKDGQAVEILLYWAYVVLGIALVSWVGVGLIVSAKTNPKSLIRMAVILVGAAAIVAIAFVLAKGNPALAYTGAPVTEGTLKLTDTILILTAIVGIAAVVAIILGEIRMSIASKK